MATETRPLVSGSYLEYMGRPLVRQDDTIIYGDMSEKCVLILEILKRDDTSKMPQSVLVQLVDPKSHPIKIIQQTDKKSLYDAFRIGVVWFDRELQED